MGPGATWWRRVAAVLATLALALAMFAAPAQATPCADDVKVSAAVADLPPAPSVETPGDPCADECCPCVCCHAHPTGAFAPMDGAAVTAPSEGRARHAMLSALELRSNLAFGLERPPRA